MIGSTGLPRAQDQIHNVIDTLAVLDDGEDGRTSLPHLPAVPLHDTEIGSDGLGKIALVHDQEIALGDAGTALSRDLVTARDVDDIDDEVG